MEPSVSSPVIANRHDDDFDLDMERVLSAVLRPSDADPVASHEHPIQSRLEQGSQSTSTPEHTGTAAVAAAPAAVAAGPGWDSFQRWVQREVGQNTVVRTPTPVLTLHGKAVPGGGDSRSIGTATPTNFGATATSPGGYWNVLSTPPRTNRGPGSMFGVAAEQLGHHSAFGVAGGGPAAAPSYTGPTVVDYTFSPSMVMPSVDRRSLSSGAGTLLGIGAGLQMGDIASPHSGLRGTSMSSTKPTSAPIFYSLSSPTAANPTGAFPGFETTSMAALSMAAAGTRLSTAAAPFTPQRLGGVGYVDPNAWGSPLSTPQHNHGYAILTPQPYHPIMNPAGSGTPVGAAVTLDMVKMNPVAAAKDQHGCRTLQRVLELPWGHKDVQDVVAMLFDDLPELMADAYGNFLVQKLLDVAPDDTRLAIANLVSPHLAHIATTPHGTFAAQKLVDSLRTSEERVAVCNGLSRAIVALCTDHNGAHVVQKVIASVGPPDRAQLFQEIAASLVDIARNRYGTCIVQRCLERSLNVPSQFDTLAQAIVTHATALVLDPFGNYVVQRLLEYCPVHSCAIDMIVRQLTAEPIDVLVQVVNSQYSSKAVERALQRASPSVSSLFCVALSNDIVMERSIGDHFGNYIVQAALGLAAIGVTGEPQTPTAPQRGKEASVHSRFSAHEVAPVTDTDKTVIGRFMAVASCVERHIGAVRMATFGKKMEAKLDAAQRALRASVSAFPTPKQQAQAARAALQQQAATTPARGGGASAKRSTPPPPQPAAPATVAVTAQQQQRQQTPTTPPPEPSLRRRPPTASP